MKNALIAQNDNATIIAQYHFTPKDSKPYQSEEDLESFLLKELESQGYERLYIEDIKDLETNLKTQLERLNNINFTPTEWDRFYKTYFTNDNLKIQDKTKILQTDNETLTLIRDSNNYAGGGGKKISA